MDGAVICPEPVDALTSSRALDGAPSLVPLNQWFRQINGSAKSLLGKSNM